MAVDEFNEKFNIIYIAKRLYDTGRYDLVTESFFDSVEYDVYYENMYTLIQNIFEYQDSRYYDYRGVDLYILSDKVIVDFFILAGKFSRRNNISDENNPYIKEAHKEVNENLNISHELEWMLMGHTEPKRPFHSRLGLFVSNDCGCLDLGVLAYRLIEIYEWFADKCVELCNILHEDVSYKLMMEMGGIAA